METSLRNPSYENINLESLNIDGICPLCNKTEEPQIITLLSDLATGVWYIINTHGPTPINTNLLLIGYKIFGSQELIVKFMMIRWKILQLSCGPFALKGIMLFFVTIVLILLMSQKWVTRPFMINLYVIRVLT